MYNVNTEDSLLLKRLGWHVEQEHWMPHGDNPRWLSKPFEEGMGIRGEVR